MPRAAPSSFYKDSLSSVSAFRARRGFQRGFFCACGRPLQARLRRCSSCIRAASDSRRRFGGHRAAVLQRDGQSCQGCGAEQILHVHHRRPGLHDFAGLITLCAACHARVHRLQTLRHWWPEPILVFWEEQHPGTPRQLQFDLEGRFAA